MKVKVLSQEVGYCGCELQEFYGIDIRGGFQTRKFFDELRWGCDNASRQI